LSDQVKVYKEMLEESRALVEVLQVIEQIIGSVGNLIFIGFI